MLHTTFRKAKIAGACPDSYRKIAKVLGGITKYGCDTPIPLDKILEVCGLDGAFWCLRATIESADRELRLLTCDYAERVMHAYEKLFPDDRRIRQIIEVSRKYANGQANERELLDVWVAANTTIKPLGRVDSGPAAWADARAISRVAWAAAEAAIWANVWDAAKADTQAVAWVDSGTIDWASARVAEIKWQEERFKELLKRI